MRSRLYQKGYEVGWTELYCRETLVYRYNDAKTKHRKEEILIEFPGNLTPFLQELFINTLWKEQGYNIQLQRIIGPEDYDIRLTIGYNCDIPPQDISLLVLLADLFTIKETINSIERLTAELFERSYYTYGNADMIALYLLFRLEGLIPITSIRPEYNGPVNRVHAELNTIFGNINSYSSQDIDKLIKIAKYVRKQVMNTSGGYLVRYPHFYTRLFSHIGNSTEEELEIIRNTKVVADKYFMEY